MRKRTLLAIRHFPDRKRPCIVLEQENECVVLGYLTDNKREKWLRDTIGLDPHHQCAVEIICFHTLDEIIDGGKKCEHPDKCHECDKILTCTYYKENE